MNNVWKKLTAGVLAAGLALGCTGCGDSLLEEVVPTATRPTVNNEPAVPVNVSGGPVSPHLLQLNNLTVAPQYPEIPQRPRMEDYPEYSEEFYEAESKWYRDRHEYITSSPENARELVPFLKYAMKQFLSGSDNQVCAPLNIYFALAMLAETTDGNSRQQILNALEHSSIQDLRDQSMQLWRAHYYNDGETTSLMANSLWLDQAYSFEEEGLSNLGNYYYASVFQGDLGSETMNKQLSQWLDSQTGSLLSDYTKEIALDPATVFALASTAYFRADWNESFNEAATKQQVFHAEDQDITTDFMHQSFMVKDYYWSDNFSAISMELSGNHKMWLILPDEGNSPRALLEQGDYYDLISGSDNWAQSKSLTVNLSMPKFDVSSDQDLIPGLKAMGITDVFRQTDANFGSITDEPIYVGSTKHAARVAVDEEGVIAAAYTMMAMCGSAAPVERDEIDFILDRPFLFTITGADDLPLFAGVVSAP